MYSIKLSQQQKAIIETKRDTKSNGPLPLPHFRYSLSRLKLDLNTIICTSECSHAVEDVNTLKRTVHAKYCNIFPTGNGHTPSSIVFQRII